MALTIAVAMICAVGRVLGPDEAIGAALIASLFGAPSIFALLLVPFGILSLTTRHRLTVGFLLLLGLAVTIVVGIVVHPTVGMFLGLFAGMLWIPQFTLLGNLHRT